MMIENTYLANGPAEIWLETFRCLPDYTYLCVAIFCPAQNTHRMCFRGYNWRATRIKKFPHRKPVSTRLPWKQCQIDYSLSRNKLQAPIDRFSHKNTSLVDRRVPKSEGCERKSDRSPLSLHPNVNTEPCVVGLGQRRPQIKAKSHSRNIFVSRPRV